MSDRFAQQSPWRAATRSCASLSAIHRSIHPRSSDDWLATAPHRRSSGSWHERIEPSSLSRHHAQWRDPGAHRWPSRCTRTVNLTTQPFTRTLPTEPFLRHSLVVSCVHPPQPDRVPAGEDEASKHQPTRQIGVTTALTTSVLKLTSSGHFVIYTATQRISFAL